MGTLVEHLETISKLKQLAGANQFSIGAYDKAAKLIRENPTISNPENLDGIGIKIAKTIEQFLKTGTSDAFKELAKTYPVDCLKLTSVQGIGPAKALKLWQHGIKTFEKLVELAEAGKLVQLETLKIGINASQLEKAVFFARDRKAGRAPYESARYVGDKVVDVLKNVPDILKLELCGSIRRKRSTIKDLDIVACVSNVTLRTSKDIAEKIFNRCFDELRKAGIPVEVLNCGESKASLIVGVANLKMMCDVWLVEEWRFGAALCYTTGSKAHGIRLRELAKARGMLINEYGIYRVSDNKRLGGEKETDIYDVLGLDYVEPVNRE